MSTELNDYQIAAVVCREFGWTLTEYENTPTEFIDTIIAMFQGEAAASKKK